MTGIDLDRVDDLPVGRHRRDEGPGLDPREGKLHKMQK